MGIFTKPTATDINLILPYIQDPPDSLVWEITDTTDGVDTVSVQAFTNVELQDHYDEFLSEAHMPKVLRYAEEYDLNTFTHLDYVRGLDIRLAPKREFTNGVLTRVDYYASVTLDAQGQEVFDDMIVCEQYDYVRNSDGFAVSRNMTIKWITEAETDHPVTKARFKTYNLTESLRETARRRQNVLDDVQTSMIGLFVQGMGMTLDQAMGAGMDFFEHHMSEITAFKEIGALTNLITAITNNTQHPWLDTVIAPPSTTARDFLIGKLSQAYLGT